MIMHWSLITYAIWVISSTITPIQAIQPPPSNLIHPTPNNHKIYNRKFSNSPTTVYHAHFSSSKHLLQEYHGHPSSSSRHLLQETVNVTAECQALFQSGIDDIDDDLTQMVENNLDPDTLQIWTNFPNSVVFSDLILGSLIQAVLEADCDFSMVQQIPLSVRISQLLTDAAQIVECAPVITAFFTASPFGQRRRLKKVTTADILSIAPEIEVAADFTDEWFDYFQGIYSAMFWDLTDAENAAVTREVSLNFLFVIATYVAESDAISAAIDAGCDPEGDGLDIIELVSESLATIRLGFVPQNEIIGTTTMTPEEEGGDEDVSDSSSGENAAKSEVYVWDNLDMNEEDVNDGEEEEVDGDNGLEEEVTLRITESTMTNLWIIVIVFCGFNLCLCWCLMGRKKKKAIIHYETAEELPSISVHH